MALLDVRQIDTRYGLSRILFGVSLTLQAGEIIALLGRNGVGKTTTLRSIMGLTPPLSGTILWDGKDIVGLPAYRIARLGIGFVPEDRRIFPDLTVWENLDIASRPRPDGSPGWTVNQAYEFFPALKPLHSRLGGHLSGGEQQMLAIARGLMGNPRLLLLDEPSEGLAPLVVRALREQIGRLRNESGLSMVLAEQNLEFVLSLADRIYVLEKGEVKLATTAADARADKGKLRRYLTV